MELDLRRSERMPVPGLRTKGLSRRRELSLNVLVVLLVSTALLNPTTQEVGHSQRIDRKTMPSQEEYFELLIWMPGQGPMRDLIKARSLQEAIHWAKFRYKNAKVEIPAPTIKPELAKSHTSPGLLKKRHLKKAQMSSENSLKNDQNS